MSTATDTGGESLTDHCVRSIKNCLQSSIFCLNKSKGQTLIQKIKLDIESRKKTFGVEYMNALKGGNKEELDDIVEKAKADIAALDEKIAAHENDIVAAEKVKDEAIAKNNEAISPTKAKPPAAEPAPAEVEPEPKVEDPAPAPAAEPAPAEVEPEPKVEDPAPAPAPEPKTEETPAPATTE